MAIVVAHLLEGLILLALLLAVAGLAFQAFGAARDVRNYPASGRLVDLGGHRLHIDCTGEGSPAVVLDSGLPATTLSWRFVQPEVAKFTRVCSFDRAGLGWSDAGPMPRTSGQIVEELHGLLENAGIEPPYVLAGHSFGGFTVQLYAHRYPHEVAGLVLVDSIYPSEWLNMTEERKKELARYVKISRRAAWFARMGMIRLYLFLIRVGLIRVKEDARLVPFLRRLPQDFLPLLRVFWSQPKPYEAVASQIEALHESAAQVAAGNSYGDRPLIVLSASNPSPSRIAEQEAGARASSNGKHLVASRSGHWIQFDEPELVIQAIREVVEAARCREPAARSQQSA